MLMVQIQLCPKRASPNLVEKEVDISYNPKLNDKGCHQQQISSPDVCRKYQILMSNNIFSEYQIQRRYLLGINFQDEQVDMNI